MSSVILLAYSSYADAATLAGGGWAGGALSNLKLDKLYQGAQSTDATLANTKFTVDFGAAQALDALFLGPTNLDQNYKVRVKGAPTNAFASGYDSGWLTSGLTAADIDPERGVTVPVVFASTQTYRWWSIELDDTANAAGFITIGRLFMPKVLRPSINYAPGSNGLALEDLSRHGETLSGVEVHGHRRARRVMNFAIPMIAESEAFGSIYAFQRTVGFDKLVFICPNPDDPAPKLQARSFWARIRAMDAISQVAFDTASIGLTASEWF